MDSTVSTADCPSSGQHSMMASSGNPGSSFGTVGSATTSTPSSSSGSQTPQYLNPDYVQPLSSSLDVKNSPLALLAQTCSSIGRDSGTAVVKSNHVAVISSISGITSVHHGRDSSTLTSSSARTKCTLSPIVKSSSSFSTPLHIHKTSNGDRKLTNGSVSRHTGNGSAGELSSSTSPASRSKSGGGASRTCNTSGGQRNGSSSSADNKSDGSPSPTASHAGSGFGVKSSSSKSDVSSQPRYAHNTDEYPPYNNNNTHLGSNLFPFGGGASELGSSSFDKFLLPALDAQSGSNLQQLHMQQAARYQNEALALQAAIQAAAFYSSSPLAALYSGAPPPSMPSAPHGSGPAGTAAEHAAAVYSASMQAAAAAAANGLYPRLPRSSDIFCTSSASTGSPCTVPGCACADSMRYPTSSSSSFFHSSPSAALMSGLFGGSGVASSSTSGLMHGGQYSCSWLQQPSGEFCGRRFSTSMELLDHLRTHATPTQSATTSQTSPPDNRRHHRSSPRPSSPSSNASSSFHASRPLVVPPLLPPLPPPPPGIGFPPSAASLFDRLSPSSLFHTSQRHQTRRDDISPLSQPTSGLSSSSSASVTSRYHPYHRIGQSSSPGLSGLLGMDPVSSVGGFLPPPPVPSSLMAAYLSSPYAASLYNSTQRLGPAVGP